jgi:broad specificity phosphatase PhoE
VPPERPAAGLEARRVFLVPPCEADEGELTVEGVRQASALGDALADVPLGAVYAGPGVPATDTATAIAQRHGLVVRRRSTLDLEPGGAWGERVVETFEAIARAGSGRTSLLVVHADAVSAIVARCAGLAARAIEPASITELRLREGGAGYDVERLADVAHLSPPAPVVT